MVTSKMGEGVSDLINFYSSSSAPVAITDIDFNLLWNNDAAKNSIFSLINGDIKNSILFKEIIQSVLNKLKNGETVTIRNDLSVPMSNVVITFVPAFNILDTKDKKRFLKNIIIYFSCTSLENNIRNDYNQLVASSFDIQVREPLSEIFTSINALKNRTLGSKNCNNEPYLSKMLQNAYKILRNYTIISDYTKFQNGLNTCTFKRVNAVEFLELLFTSVKVVTENREQKIIYKIDIDKTIYIDIDEEKLITAFMQFISNSCKHRDKNVTIRINSYLSEDRVFIRVEDNARGIKKDIIPNIFTPYYSYSPIYPSVGTGLGLPVAKMIINQHGGTLAISSEEDIGTVVAFSIEAKKESPNQNLTLNTFPSELILDKFSPIFIYLSDSLTPPAF